HLALNKINCWALTLWLLTGVGVLRNSSLLYVYMLTLFTKHTQRPTDLILNQLTLANFLVLFSRGIPQTLDAFGLKYFLGEVESKSGPGVSLCTTCLLSDLQAITISPSNSRCAKLKLKAPTFVQPAYSLCWILHLLINIVVRMKLTHPGNAINMTEKYFGLCSSKRPDSFLTSLYAFLLSFLDILCLVPMGWASGSILLFLQRHKQRVRYTYHTSLSPRASPETSATHTVLLLVGSFGSFYSLSSILSLYMMCFVNLSLQLVNISAFLVACFPAFNPFVLISHDTQILRTYFCYLW
ncbi:hypothetical protein E2I00_010332, partial [Balaenoptera physalus]